MTRKERRAARLKAARIANPEYLNIADVSELTGYSVPYLYILTHRRQIPFHKPNGGYIHFRKSEILAWYNARKGGRFNFSE